MMRRTIPIFGLVLGVSLGATVRVSAQSAPVSSVSKLTLVGPIHPTFGPGVNSATDDNLFVAGPETNRSFQRFITGSVSSARVPSNQVPSFTGSSPTPGTWLQSFDGVTHRNHRLAGSGVYTNTQLSLEPPDQGLAVGGTGCNGNPCVVEAVNDVLAFYDSTTHAQVGTFLPINQFFALSPEVIRTPPVTFGPELTDPRVYFDPVDARWFISVLELGRVAATGALDGTANLFLAVSVGSDPTGAYNLYSLDVHKDGTGCSDSVPCFGDQPLIGADANAFFVSTNSFVVQGFGSGFFGAQLYAIDKAALEAGGVPNFQHFDLGSIATPDPGGIWYSVQPAIIPPGGGFESGDNGTEYFLSALQFFGTLDNRIEAWAATNTASITTTPDIQIAMKTVDSEIYGQPPAQQQPAVTPSQFCAFGLILACDITTNAAAAGLPTTYQVHEELVATNDDRMQQVEFAAGKLWSGLNTVVKTQNGPVRTAAAYFIVTPSISGTATSPVLNASMYGNGYIAANSESLSFPSIAVNSSGSGFVGLSIIGPDFTPSAVYCSINLSGAGPLHLVSFGAVEDDGFTGYPPESGLVTNVGRWGDYSSAVVGPDGNVWIANEYIPNASRTLFANWGTRITQLAP